MSQIVCKATCVYVNLCVIYRLKYIMLLKFPIILSGNSFNFYLLFPKLFLTFYCKCMQLCYKNHIIDASFRLYGEM